jgi:hypothetical protein
MAKAPSPTKVSSGGFTITFDNFNVGAAPTAHLDTLTETGNGGHYAQAVNVDVISQPEHLIQGMGLATLTAGTESGAITELVNHITDRPVSSGVAYGIAATKLHQISATAVTNAGGIFPHTITNATAGNSVVSFQGALYYFYNKASGADCGKYDLATTFTDAYFSVTPTGAAALVSAPHPVATKQDIMLFGNGRYVGYFTTTGVILNTTKLDFGSDAQVADIVFHANMWWICVNVGTGVSTDRQYASIYMYDPSATTSLLTDEVAVGAQKIGFILPIEGILYVAYQDLTSAGGFCIGYISGRAIKPLAYFKGTLPTFAQKALFNNTIIFLSGKNVYSCGAVVESLPVQISQLASGGYTTCGALAAPFGTPMVASTQSTSFKIAKFSGYDVNSNWRSIVIPVIAGQLVGYVDKAIVLTNNLAYGARCDLSIEADQATKIGSTQIITTTSTKSAAFTANATTDYITSVAHGLSNGDVVVLTTTVTLPAGLSLLTPYYVINKTTDTFQLSLTSGGTNIDITDTGTGVHTFTNVVGKRRHTFNSLGLNMIEDLRLFLNFVNGSAVNPCEIRRVIVQGHYVEKK